jgi:quercetin 2,3-dioxygenase
MLLYGFAQELKRCLAISRSSDEGLKHSSTQALKHSSTQALKHFAFMIDGALEHKDSMGTGSIIRPGDVQRMTAGTGVTHSEFNPNAEEGARFLQIWIMPEQAGLTPGYEQKAFPVEERTNRLRLIADRAGRDGAVTVHQDVSLYAATLTENGNATHSVKSGRHVWVQVVRGLVDISADADKGELREGDGAAISAVKAVTLASQTGAEVLLLDLA